MCFYAVEKDKKVAEEDLICYKQVNVDTNGKITSDVRSFTYKVGRKYGGFLKRLRLLLWDSDEDGNGEGFHSHIEQGYHDNLRCTIPKGAVYYVGHNEYFSSSIRIEELVLTPWKKEKQINEKV